MVEFAKHLSWEFPTVEIKDGGLVVHKSFPCRAEVPIRPTLTSLMKMMLLISSAHLIAPFVTVASAIGKAPVYANCALATFHWVSNPVGRGGPARKP